MFEMILSLAALAAIVLLWVCLYDTHRFTITHKTITDGRIKKSCRFVVFSDLHGKQYGRDNEVLLKAIREQKPDGILIVGDMITAHKKFKTEQVEKLLCNLCKLCPVYYVSGNHEQKVEDYGEKVFGKLPLEYARILKESGVTMLINRREILKEYGLCIYGLEIGREYYKRLEYPKLPEDYVEKRLGAPERDLYGVLLAHSPDYFENYAFWGADLVLSGHVHGGIMRLPILGGVIAPSLKLFPKYDSGIFTQGESTMLLSRGIGTHFPDMRFFNPGELIVLEFKGETS